MITIVLLLALVGFLSLARRKPRGAVLVASVVAVPLVALVLAKLGSAAPMSRHLIFILPFFALVVAEGADPGRVTREALGAADRRPRHPGAAPRRDRVGHAPNARAVPRRGGRARSRAGDASAYIASIARPDDVLFGYEPLYLEALDKGGRLSKLVVPRADATLALSALQSARKPLGHGLWVFDASDTTNVDRKQTIPLRSPYEASDFEVKAFGPFLVIRTVKPTNCVQDYLKIARRVELLGASLGLGDGDVNLGTVLTASGRLTNEKHPPAC